MLAEGVHFVEFRPEVSDGASTAEPEEEMVGKTRFGRPGASDDHTDDDDDYP